MNPVQDLIEQLEKSVAEADYEQIRFKTTTHNLYASIDDITYITRYFFKVKTAGSEYVININNLELIEIIR